MTEKGLDRVSQHRLAADVAILLGHALPGADAAAAGDDKGMDDHERRYTHVRGAKGENCGRRADEPHTRPQVARACRNAPKTVDGLPSF